MKKTLFTSVVCFFLGIFLFPNLACADIGPKPSVNIEFDGLENKAYYITLLSSGKSTGPYSFDNSPIDETSYLLEENKQEGLAAWQAFRNYTDQDGFYFINYFKRCNSENTFGWGYYPPDTFKILIYFPQSNTFAASDIQQKYAFDSYYQVSVSQEHTILKVEKSYDFSAEVWSLLARIVATVAIEIIIALLFRLKRKNIILFLIAVNVSTQIVLNVLLNCINYASGGFAFVLNYIWMELLIIAIEAIAFSVYFRKAQTNKPIKKWIAPVYAIVSNIVSFLLGLMIAIKLPGIF